MKLDWILNVKPKGWWWLLFSSSHSHVDSASFNDAKWWAIAKRAILGREREWECESHRDSEKDLWAHWTNKMWWERKYMSVCVFECQIWLCKDKRHARFIHFSYLFIDGIKHAFSAFTAAHHRLPGVFTVIYVINVMLFTISQKKASCCSNKVLLSRLSAPPAPSRRMNT